MKAWNVQVALLFGTRVVQTTMRMAIAPLLSFIVFPDSSSVVNKGILLSAFPLGYLSTQLLGGWAADFIGPRIVVTSALGLSAGAMTLCAFARNSDHLFWCTVALGVAQGPLFPTGMAYLSKWLPPKERAYAATMLDSGTSVGSLIGLPISGFLGAKLGWETTFAVYGIFAALFTVLWHVLSSDLPKNCWYINKSELAMLDDLFVEKGVGTPKKESAATEIASLGIVGLLSKPAIWAIFVSHFAFNFSVYFQNSWTPIFYASELKINPDEAGFHFVVPHIANLAIKLVVSGALNAYLSGPQVGLSLKGCRRFFTVAGFIGSSIGLAAIGAFGGGAKWTTVWFTVAMAFAALHPSGFKTNYMDVTRHNSGALSGVGNTVATAASYVGPIIVDRLRDSRGWPAVFSVVAGVNLVAAAFFGLASTATPLDVPGEFKSKIL